MRAPGAAFVATAALAASCSGKAAGEPTFKEVATCLDKTGTALVVTSPATGWPGLVGAQGVVSVMFPHEVGTPSASVEIFVARSSEDTDRVMASVPKIVRTLPVAHPGTDRAPHRLANAVLVWDGSPSSGDESALDDCLAK